MVTDDTTTDTIVDISFVSQCKTHDECGAGLYCTQVGECAPNILCYGAAGYADGLMVPFDKRACPPVPEKTLQMAMRAAGIKPRKKTIVALAASLGVVGLGFVVLLLVFVLRKH